MCVRKLVPRQRRNEHARRKTHDARPPIQLYSMAPAQRLLAMKTPAF
jgi:hypothetical protein